MKGASNSTTLQQHPQHPLNVITDVMQPNKFALYVF